MQGRHEPAGRSLRPRRKTCVQQGSPEYLDTIIEEIEARNPESAEAISAALSRDKVRYVEIRQPIDMQEICLVPPSIISQCGVQADDYQYEWIVMLCRISNGENLAGMLDALNAATTPDRVEIAPRDHVEQTLWLARAAEAARAGNAAAVNDALAKALALHRKIWEEKPDSWLGYMSFDATAIACWAIDQGIAITVESEYMPSSLLPG